MIYLWATLLLLGNLLAWCGTFFMLPGNWIIVLLTALYAWLVRPEQGPAVSWTTVVVLVVLALLGELTEFAAGAAGAAKQGGSRRGMLLSILGAMIGSILGATVGIPVPIIGSVLGALGGAAIGAYAGAYLGESWKGRADDQRHEISKAAMLGRLLGTVGKLVIGIVMVVIATLDSFLTIAGY